MLPLNTQDIDCIQTILSNGGFPEPNMKISFYKNRRGKYKGIYLWCVANLGTCRIDPIFATTWDYRFIELENVVLN